MFKRLKTILLGVAVAALIAPGVALAARTSIDWVNLSGTSYIQPNFPSGVDLLIFGSNRYINFNTVTGSSGYGLRDNAGTLEFKNSGGSWTGIGAGGSGSPGGTTGQLQYNSSGSFAGVSTTTASCAGTASCSSFVVIGSSPVTITGAAGSASSTLLGDNNTFSGTLDSFTNPIVNGTLSGLVGANSGQTYAVSTSSLNASITGNAGTATVLQTARAINGQNFDGSAPITITAASSTVLANNNTFSGTNTFSTLPVLGTLSGLIKGTSGTLSAASNGTDFTLITAKTCTGSDFVSSVTAAGVFTCTTPAGTTYTGTWPITVTGSIISWSGLATSSNLTSSRVHYSTGVNTFADVATSSIASGVGITVTNGSAAYVIGSQPSVACNTANGTTFGCLTAADWLTFNNKVATSAVPTVGNVAYWTGAGTPSTLGTVGTSSIASGVGITVTNGSTAYVIGAQPSIACNTATGSVFGCLAAADFTTFNAKQAPGFQISTSSPVIGGLAYYTSAIPTTIGNVATSAPLLGSEFTYTGGTIGYFVGGTGATLHIGAGGVSNTMLANKTIVVNGTTLTLGDGADTITAASSTLLSNNNTFTGGNLFTASTTIGGGSVTTGLTIAGTATTSNLIDTSLTSALALFDSNHKETAYGGASACGSNNFFTGFSAVGASTCGTASITLNGSSVALGGSATISSTTLLANNNTFSGNNTFSASTTFQAITNLNSASSTLFSASYASSTQYFGAGLASCSGSNFLQWTAGVFGCAAGGGGGAFPFTPTTYGTQSVVATSTGVWFTASPLSLIASSTFFTNATTTNATTTNLFVGTDGGTNDSILTMGPANHEWSIVAASTSAATANLFSIASSTNGGTPAFTIDKNLIATIVGGFVSQASSTIVGNFTTTGTAKIGTLAGLLLGTSGTVSAYAGSAPCTNQVALSLSSTGVITCTSIADAMFTGTLGLSHGGTNASLTGANQLVHMNSGNTALELGGANYIFTTAGSGLLTAANASTTAFTAGSYFESIGNAGFGSTTPGALVGINAPAGTTWPFLIGSTTSSIFGINPLGGITLKEYLPATSTAITLDWAGTGRQLNYQIGTAGVTITIINATTSLQAGSTKLVWICNPAGSAGALTWVGVEWVGATPAQTTTTNQCDVYNFDITSATSTTAYKVAGTQGAGFQ